MKTTLLRVRSSWCSGFLLYGIGLVWLLFAFHSYYPGLNENAVCEILSRLWKNLTSPALFAALLIALVLTSSLCLARKLFQSARSKAFRSLLDFKMGSVGAAYAIGTGLAFFLLFLSPFDVLLMVWIWLNAYFLGKKLLHLMSAKLDPGLENLSFSSALGFSTLSLFTLVLAILKLLYRPLVFGLLLVISLGWIREIRTGGMRILLRLFTPSKGSASRRYRFVHGFLFLFVAVNLVLAWITALGPAIEYDDLLYHLTGPKAFVSSHSLIKVPDIPHIFFPKNIEMLFTLGMLLHNEVTAKLIHCLLGFLTMLSTYTFASKRWGHTVGLVALAILTSSPLFLWEMGTAHVDAALSLYMFLGLYSAVKWLQVKDWPWFMLAVFFTGFSLGVKYIGLLGVASLTIVIFITRLFQDKCILSPVIWTARFAFLSLLGLIPWGLVNLLQTGNPIFPFFNDFFQSPYWTHDLSQMFLRQQKEDALVIGFKDCWRVISVFWQMLADQTNRFHGRIGPFFFILIPLLILLKRKVKANNEIKLIMFFSLVYSLIWIFATQHSRYYLPCLPGLAIVGAYAIVNWIKQGRRDLHEGFEYLVVALLILMTSFSTPFFGRYGTHQYYGSSLLPSLPLKYLLGKETRDRQLSVWVPSYSAVQYLNRLPGTKKVLFWWNTLPCAFYLDGASAWLFSPFVPPLLGNDPQQIHRILRQNAVGYLIAAEKGQRANLITDPAGQFVRHYLRLIYTGNETLLYEVLEFPKN